MSFTSKNIQHSSRSGITFLKGATRFFLGMSCVLFLTHGFEITPSVRNARQYIQKIIFTEDGYSTSNQTIIIDGASGSISAEEVCIGGVCKDIRPTGGGDSVWTIGANNVAYYNTGNVGIGTPSPRNKLTVIGTGFFDQGLIVNGNIQPEDLGDELKFKASNYFFKDGGGTTNVIIDSDGNLSLPHESSKISIGTGTFSNYTATINGNMKISHEDGSYTNGDIYTNNTRFKTYIGKYTDENNLGSTNYGVLINGSGDFGSSIVGLRVVMQNITRRAATFIGRVGIGTSSPAYDLDVAGTGKFSSGLIVGETANIEKIIAGDGLTIQSNGGIGAFLDDELHFLSTSGLLTILSNGNVGIGTYGPNTSFHVRGNLTDGGTAQRVAYFDHSTKMGLGLEIMAGDESGIIRNTKLGKHLEFGTYNGSIYNDDQLFLHSGGNVGIDTSNPVAKLHVNGGIKISNEYGTGIEEGDECGRTLEGTIIYKRVTRNILGTDVTQGVIFVCRQNDLNAGTPQWRQLSFEQD